MVPVTVLPVDSFRARRIYGLLAFARRFTAASIVVAAAGCSEHRDLTVHAAVIGAGAITSKPAGLRCTGEDACAPARFSGSTVALTASAGADAPFSGWLLWSGRQSDSPRLATAATVTLARADAGPDGALHVFAFFGAAPDTGVVGLPAEAHDASGPADRRPPRVTHVASPRLRAAARR